MQKLNIFNFFKARGEPLVGETSPNPEMMGRNLATFGGRENEC